MQHLINFIAPILPYKISARLDHLSRHKKNYFPFGGPMNGSTARLEAVRELIDFCDVQLIVETGTFRGTTTEWAAQFGVPVISFEVVPRFAEFSRIRLAKKPNVEIITQSSSQGIQDLIDRGVDVEAITLFYLDAHWYDYLPLRHEYELICKNFKRPIIVVDDFRVEDDDGYAFAAYDDDVLALEYMTRPEDNFGAHIYFPTTPAHKESGARTGYVVVTTDNDLANIIETRIPLLRSFVPF